jgi:hypothetical protein
MGGDRRVLTTQNSSAIVPVLFSFPGGRRGGGKGGGRGR